MSLFGTSGIRGIVNKDHYPDFYLHMALVIGTVIKDKKVALAADGRLTMHVLKNAIISGLTATGHDVVDLGVLPTPGLQYYCKTHGLPGVMVTASHNPPEYNGVKLIMADGLDTYRNEHKAIEELYASAGFQERAGNGKSKINYVPWDKVGSLAVDASARDLYIEGVLKNVDVASIRDAKLTVMSDCVNGSTTQTAHELLKRLGIKEIAVNGTLDGHFPGHNPEPSLENVTGTLELAKKSKIDFGVIFDSDGDRSIFVSPKGEYLDGNYLVPIVALSKVKRGDTVVVPVNTADTLARVLKRIGANLDETIIGRQSVVKEMVRTGAILGGEENGAVIYRGHQLCGDGMMALVMFAEIIAKEGLDKLMKQVSQLAYRRTKIQTGAKFDAIKEAMLKATKYTDANYLDGVKLRIDDDTWIMARPSGTEPLIRIYAQARNERLANELLDRYKAIIAKVK